MKKFRLLVLTDHTNHKVYNSLYSLVRAMRVHPRCLHIDVATSGNPLNTHFFNSEQSEQISVTTVDDFFDFYEDGRSYNRNQKTRPTNIYDLIWLRMPPPLNKSFIDFLEITFYNQIIINAPRGIYESGSKAFLTNFADLCPPIKICKTVGDIIEFKNQFPIVLKPFRGYGGKGIVKIDGNKAWEGNKEMSLDLFLKHLNPKEINYLGMKFLRNVYQGDKRIVIVDSEIMGATLRLPPKGSWMCNITSGGSFNFSEVDEDEIKIVKTINPVLSKMGIVMYGVDTLVGDDGKRVLSEINTTSIGALPQIARLSGKPLIKKAAELIWSYCLKNKLKGYPATEVEMRSFLAPRGQGAPIINY